MRKKANFLIILFGIFLMCAAHLGPANRTGAADYDILIKNARVFDGSLKQAFPADVAVKDGRIIEVSRGVRGRAEKVIDASGLWLSPGFIDLHTHVDEGMYFPENRACFNYLKQGVTSVVVGQCGGSAWPVFEKAEDLIRIWESGGIGPNAALLVGHGTVRQLVLGMEDREPTLEELEKMKALVKEGMDQGACGLSTGLIYLPGRFAKTAEVIELAKVVAPYGGIYHTHVRDERNLLLDAVKEAITIAETAKVPAHISHFKVMGKPNWGLVKDACAIVEEARARGLDITADQYPYQFSSGYPYRSLIPRTTWLGKERAESLSREDIDAVFDLLRDTQLIKLYKKTTPYTPLSPNHEKFLRELPRKRLVSFIGRTLIDMDSFQGPENPRERMLFWERMRNPEQAAEIQQQIEGYIDDLVGPENFIVGVCVEKNLEGKSLKQVAALKGISVADAAIELELMGAKCVPLQMCEPDIETIMSKDYVGTGSDGTAPFYGIGLTHVRSYSAFLHKIKKYALERKAVSVPHVIRSQTSLPAQIMNWDDRGWIKKGYKADIVVFDLENIRTETSISNPHVYSQGVEYLLINGELVLDKGGWTGVLPGKILRLKKS